MIGLIDIDGTLPNLALMKLSKYYKSMGEQVEFVQPGHDYARIFASAIFTRSKCVCEELMRKYGATIELGGTGWDIDKTRPPDIEHTRPDYDLYTTDMLARKMRGIGTRAQKQRKAETIVNAGLGFTSRGWCGSAGSVSCRERRAYFGRIRP